jgi:hypothetical protein
MASAGGKTKEELIASGTWQKNQARYKDRFDGPSKNDTPLGEPPSHLDIGEAYCWRLFKEEMPWLQKSDTTMVEMACKLRSQLIQNSLDPKNYATLRALIIQISGTPLSRDRMRAPAENSEDKSENADLFG